MYRSKREREKKMGGKREEGGSRRASKKSTKVFVRKLRERDIMENTPQKRSKNVFETFKKWRV